MRGCEVLGAGQKDREDLAQYTVVGRVPFDRDVILMTCMASLGALDGRLLTFLVFYFHSERSALYTCLGLYAWRLVGVLAYFWIWGECLRDRFLYIPRFLRFSMKSPSMFILCESSFHVHYLCKYLVSSFERWAKASCGYCEALL